LSKILVAHIFVFLLPVTKTENGIPISILRSKDQHYYFQFYKL
jgi:hypothetical protein